MINWKMVSYYTDDYSRWYQPFVDSLDEFGIKHYIKRYEGTGSWHANVANKMIFILDCLMECESDIVWCDVDARLLRYPEVFDQLNDYDFAAYKLEVTPDIEPWIIPDYPFKPKSLYYTGTMYFRNNEKVKRFLRKWIQKHEEYKSLPHPTQASLYWAIKDTPELTIYDLPEEYCWIKAGIVFEHYCASVKKK